MFTKAYYPGLTHRRQDELILWLRPYVNNQTCFGVNPEYQVKKFDESGLAEVIQTWNTMAPFTRDPMDPKAIQAFE